MVHRIELAGGRAIGYSSRWVRTRRLAEATGTRPPRGTAQPIDGPANAHVIWHAGRILALDHSGLPHRLTPGLGTVCVEDFDAMLTSPMCAHPKVDPVTGAMAFFGYDPFGPPFLRYHELDATGGAVHSTAIAVPAGTTGPHDFGVTATRIAIVDEAGARIGLLRRGGGGEDIRWFGVDPVEVLHVMNAYDEGAGVVLDLCCRPGPTEAVRLERWTVGPARVQVGQLDDRIVDFPRVDPSLTGQPYRYGYCVEVGPGGLVRYDLVRDEATVRRFGPGQLPGEPVFVRAPDGRADDEGWVLTVVHNAHQDRSDLVILDASAFAGPPEAIVHLPAALPGEGHGSWLPVAVYR